MKNMESIFPKITYCSSIEKALTCSDAVIILTEWDEFKHIDWKIAGSLMNQRIIVDMRNIVDIASLQQLQFQIYGINGVFLY